MDWLVAIASMGFVLWVVATLFFFPTLVPVFRRKWGADFQPSVTVFKPLHGADPDLAENLRSFFRQNYPRYRIVIGVSSDADPALPVARAVREEFPQLDITIVSGAPLIGPNAKVSNLAHMAKTTSRNVERDEIWVISDADVRVAPDWLREITAPFAEPSAGAVSCFYRSAVPPNLPTQIEAIHVNADFQTGARLASRFFRMPVTLGATMAVRRDLLEQLGGFPALADYLADDYHLGELIANLGHRVRIADYIVDLREPPMGWGELWVHQLRWTRTYRVCQPLGFFFSILANGFAWCGWLALALAGAGQIEDALLVFPFLLLFVSLVRIASVGIIIRRLFQRSGNCRYAFAAPLHDFMRVALWFCAWGNTVRWRGKTFRIQSDGRMKENP